MCAGLYWVFNRNMMWHLFIGGVKKALYASSWPKVFGWIRKVQRTFLYSPNEEENFPQSHSSFPLHLVFSLYFLSQTKHPENFFFSATNFWVSSSPGPDNVICILKVTFLLLCGANYLCEFSVYLLISFGRNVKLVSGFLCVYMCFLVVLYLNF